MRINIGAFPAKSWLAFSLWLVASTGPSILPAFAADTVAIKNIYLNQDKQLVVEFDNPTHISPIAPQVLDYPGDKHDIVLEFTNTSFAIGKVPRAKAVLEELTKAFPTVNSIAYAASNDSTKARIKLSVSKDIATHPNLAKVDQDSAVINLDLPATAPIKAVTASTATSAPATTPAETTAAIPTTIASTAPSESTATASTATAAEPAANVPTVTAAATPGIAATTAATAPANDAAEQAASKTTSEATTQTPNSGLTSKAVHGLKGAWQSSLKAGSGLTKIFGNKQKSAQPETPPVASNDAGSETNTNAIPAEPAAAAPAITAAVPSEPASPASAITTAAAIPEPASSIPAATTTAAIPEPASSTPVATTTAAIPEPASSTPVATTAAAIPELTPSPPATKNATDIAASAAPSAIPAPSSEIIDRKLLDLPRITMQPQPQETASKDLITPLKPDEVKPEQKPEIASVSQPEPAAPLTTKTVTGDSSIIDDLKTGFTPPPTKEKDKETKESAATSPEKTASTSDTASSAAKNDTAVSLTDAETKKAISKFELKAMAAQNGGKDYFPPKMPSDGQESAYNDETLKHYNEAVRFHLLGKLPEAITEYRAALVGNPRMEEAHSNLGLIFNQQNKYDQAMVEFHKALAINPKDAITYNGIGAAMRAQRNMLAAVKNWQTAISLDPNLASAHYNLGTAYEMDKDLEKALTEYKIAVKCDDKLGEAYYHMGLILEKMNNRSLALEQFKQAIKVSAEADYSQDAKHRMNLLSQKKGELIQ